MNSFARVFQYCLWSTVFNYCLMKLKINKTSSCETRFYPTLSSNNFDSHYFVFHPNSTSMYAPRSPSALISSSGLHSVNEVAAHLLLASFHNNFHPVGWTSASTTNTMLLQFFNCCSFIKLSRFICGSDNRRNFYLSLHGYVYPRSLLTEQHSNS